MLRGGRAAEQKSRALAGLGRELQAAQALAVGLVEPGEHRAAGTGAQGLFNRPQGIGPRAWMDEEYVIEIHAGALECRRIRDVGRRHECQPAIALRETHERRQQQTQLTDAGAVDQDFGERALRPAAVQHGIEFRVAGRESGRRGSEASAPDIGALHQVFEAHRSFCWRMTPTPTPSITSGVRRRSISIGSNSGFSGSRRTICPRR